uniref:L1 transposable element RRM domain-containing protein n=1 Tax=Dicentrarchus labrax TaxID=13489 RepID=A0A8P4G4W4_DICLA
MNQGKRSVETRLTSATIQLEEVENRIADVEDSNTSMINENKVLRQRVEQLWSHVDDQENRGRCKNIKLIGLKEGKETGNAMNDYIKKILNEGLGLQGDEYEIERSHRSGGPRTGDDQPPRMILEKFLRYMARQKVLTAAKKERGIRWEDCTPSIYEAMTKERSDLRRQFSPIMKALWDHRVKHTLAHPAVLRFTWKGKRLSFTDPKKDEVFVRENIQSTEND